MTQRSDGQERDPALASAWSAQSRELPSPALDQSILAAAHRAVQSGPRDAAEPSPLARRPQRWWMPLAAAAVIGIVAIGVVQVMPENELLTPHEKLVATPSTRSAATNAETDSRKQNASRPQTSPEPVSADRGQRAEGSLNATPADRTQRNEGGTLPTQPPAMAARAPAAAGAPAAAAAPATPATAQPPIDKRARADEPSVRRDSDAAGAQKSMPPRETANPSASGAASTAPTPDRAGKVAAAPEPFPGAMPASRTSEHKAEFAAPPAVPSPPPAARDAPVPQSAGAPSAPTSTSPGAPAATAASPAPVVAPPAPISSAPAPSRFASQQPSPLREAATGSEPTGRAAMPMRQPAPTTLAKTADGDARAKARDPDAWLARIRKLHDEGDVPTAERELREFRQLVPDADARIPPDLRAWAATVR